MVPALKSRYFLALLWPPIEFLALGLPTSLSPDPSVFGAVTDGVSIEPAVQYVQKIKQRCDEATYRRFLEILGKYHNMADAVDEASISFQGAYILFATY